MLSMKGTFMLKLHINDSCQQYKYIHLKQLFYTSYTGMKIIFITLNSKHYCFFRPGTFNSTNYINGIISDYILAASFTFQSMVHMPQCSLVISKHSSSRRHVRPISRVCLNLSLRHKSGVLAFFWLHVGRMRTGGPQCVLVNSFLKGTFSFICFQHFIIFSNCTELLWVTLETATVPFSFVPSIWWWTFFTL